MGMNFPTSPQAGDRYPVTPVPDTPQYLWNGITWLSVAPVADEGSSIYVGDTPPPSPPDKALWWESDSGKLMLRYADGDSSQWVQTALTTSPGVSRATLYAAPFDAMAYSGMQINGSFDVSQEKALGASTVTADGYACDGWQLGLSGALTGNLITGSSGLFPGISGYLRLNAVSGATPATTDHLCIVHRIEGYRLSRLAWGTANAQPVTIGFWVRNTLAGTYSVAVRNSLSDRSYVTSYTQNVADAQEYKTITIPGCTDGVWQTGNLVGAIILFTLAAGPGRVTASPNTWVSANASTVAGQVNGAAATTNYLRLGGVVVLPGIEAPSAAQSSLIMRPFDQELLACKRYFETSYPPNLSVGTATWDGAELDTISPANARRPTRWQVPFTVVKRAFPTGKIYSPQNGAVGNIWNSSINVSGSVFNGDWRSGNAVLGADQAPNTQLQYHWTADARL